MSFLLGIPNTYLHIVDSFEDQSLSEYTVNNGNWKIEASGTPASSKDGVYLLTNSATDDGSGGLISTSGLDNYLTYPGAARCWVYLGASGSAEVLFGAAGTDNNHFEVDLVVDNGSFTNRFELEKVSEGSRSLIADIGYTFSTNAWYEIEIRWGTGTSEIEVELFNESGVSQVTLTSSDSSFQTQSGVGFQAVTDAVEQIAFDYYRLI